MNASKRSWAPSEGLLHYEQSMDLLFLAVVENLDRDDSMQISTLDKTYERRKVRANPIALIHHSATLTGDKTIAVYFLKCSRVAGRHDIGRRFLAAQGVSAFQGKP